MHQRHFEKITDFTVGIDLIELDSFAMRSLSNSNGGVLAEENFALNYPHDVNDYIIYNMDTGTLFYDQDGSRNFYKAEEIALLAPQLLLSYHNFIVS